MYYLVLKEEHISPKLSQLPSKTVLRRDRNLVWRQRIETGSATNNGVRVALGETVPPVPIFLSGSIPLSLVTCFFYAEFEKQLY